MHCTINALRTTRGLLYARPVGSRETAPIGYAVRSSGGKLRPRGPRGSGACSSIADAVDGGAHADDQVFGEGSNDRMIWNRGDDTDSNEGGAGDDTVEVNGGNGADAFTPTGTRVRFDRVDPAPFSIDVGTSENVVLDANGGDNSFSASGNLAALNITPDGGAGNDSLLGSNGVDLRLGDDGNDFVDGQQGNDVGFLGAGDDVFQWDPGDGSDVVGGQAGTDRMLFNGSGAAEIFEASANGGRVRFTRNVGAIVMDLNDIEAVDVNALGGTDTTIVNDPSGTDVVELNGSPPALSVAPPRRGSRRRHRQRHQRPRHRRRPRRRLVVLVVTAEGEGPSPTSRRRAPAPTHSPSRRVVAWRSSGDRRRGQVFVTIRAVVSSTASALRARQVPVGVRESELAIARVHAQPMAVHPDAFGDSPGRFVVFGDPGNHRSSIIVLVSG